MAIGNSLATHGRVCNYAARVGKPGQAISTFGHMCPFLDQHDIDVDDDTVCIVAVDDGTVRINAVDADTVCAVAVDDSTVRISALDTETVRIKAVDEA